MIASIKRDASANITKNLGGSTQANIKPTTNAAIIGALDLLRYLRTHSSPLLAFMLKLLYVNLGKQVNKCKKQDASITSCFRGFVLRFY